jgi:hypothetical protein
LLRNVKMAENRGANLHRCGDRNRLLLATAISRRSSSGPPPVSALRFLRRRGRRMVIFRKLGEKVVFIPIESAGQCLALTRRNHALSGVPQVMMSPVQRLQMGGVCHFRNMTMPRAGTGNRESAGTAHVKGPVSMACSWYLCLQQETACSMS